MAQFPYRGTSLSFSTLIAAYKAIQSSLLIQVKSLATNMSSANPGAFIVLQFQMSQVTQIGESISNLVSQLNSVINSSIRNQKPQ
jgi:hypothetical protein